VRALWSPRCCRYRSTSPCRCRPARVRVVRGLAGDRQRVTRKFQKRGRPPIREVGIRWTFETVESDSDKAGRGRRERPPPTGGPGSPRTSPSARRCCRHPRCRLHPVSAPCTSRRRAVGVRVVLTRTGRRCLPGKFQRRRTNPWPSGMEDVETVKGPPPKRWDGTRWKPPPRGQGWSNRDRRASRVGAPCCRSPSAPP